MTERTGRRRRRAQPRSEDRAGPDDRVCDRPGCDRVGRHRAPRGRDQLREYYWFCLEHVRDYNRSWNYCAGLSEDAVEALMREEACWNRPSWPFGTVGADRAAERARAHMDDPFGFFDAERADSAGTYQHWRAHQGDGAAYKEAGARAQGRDPDAETAFEELELPPGATFAEIRQQYRRLVKRHHPDANGGCKAAEARLKRINDAYATLKARYASRSPA